MSRFREIGFTVREKALDRLRDPIGGRFQRMIGKMRVAGGGLRAAVPEQRPDDQHTVAGGRTDRGEAVAKIVEADVLQCGGRADALPDRLKIGDVGAVCLARQEEGIAGDLGNGRDGAHRRGAEMDDLRAGLAVGQPQTTVIAVDVAPLQRQDLALAAAGEDQQPDRRQRERAFHPERGRRREHLAQPRQLGRREKPLHLLAGIFADAERRVVGADLMENAEPERGAQRDQRAVGGALDAADAREPARTLLHPTRGPARRDLAHHRLDIAAL